MLESAPIQSSVTTAPSEPSEPSAQAVAEVIAELEAYRERLIEDFTTAAKKAKLPKSMAMAQLKSHPEIVKIEASLSQLRGQSSTAHAAAAHAAIKIEA